MSDARPNSNVIERIRKILAKTEEAGCTEAEAQTAYAMAARIMAEYNLDMAEISAAGPNEESWTEAEAGASGRYSLEMSLANGIVQNHFFVQGILQTHYRQGKRVKVLRYFGKASNVEVAAWTLQALLRAFDRLWDDHRRQTRCAGSERRLFVAGVARGFGDKLRDERRAVEIERDIIHGSKDGSTALALRSVDEETKAALATKYPKMKSHKSAITAPRGSESTLEAGIRAGRNLNLNRSIGTHSNQKRLPGQ